MNTQSEINQTSFDNGVLDSVEDGSEYILAGVYYSDGQDEVVFTDVIRSFFQSKLRKLILLFLSISLVVIFAFALHSLSGAHFVQEMSSSGICITGEAHRPLAHPNDYFTEGWLQTDFGCSLQSFFSTFHLINPR